MAKIFRKTHNPYAPCAIAHSLTLRNSLIHYSRMFHISCIYYERPMLNVEAALDIVKNMLCSIINYGNMFISTCNT